MTNPKPIATTLDRIRKNVGKRTQGWLKQLTPEERATVEQLRIDHHNCSYGPYDLSSVLRNLQADFGKRVVSIKTFREWMSENPAAQGRICFKGKEGK